MRTGDDADDRLTPAGTCPSYRLSLRQARHQQNAPSLRNDSLRRLTGLLAELQIGEAFVENLIVSGKRPYSEFKKTILRRISLELGDNFSPSVQWMVEFGFDLAASYSLLVTATNNKSSAELKDCIEYLGSRFPRLLLLAQKSKLSKKIVSPLVKSWAAVRQPKTKLTAHKCCKEMGLIVNQLLVTKTAIKLLN